MIYIYIYTQILHYINLHKGLYPECACDKKCHCYRKKTNIEKYQCCVACDKNFVVTDNCILF
jgi:hypothetical protein